MPPLPGLHLVSGVDERRRSSVACIAFWSGFGALGVSVGMSMYTCTVSCGAPASALHSSSGDVQQCAISSSQLAIPGVSVVFTLGGGKAADGVLSHASQSRLRSAADVAKMVGNIRFLTLVKPVLHVLPEVAQPDRKIPFKARLPA